MKTLLYVKHANRWRDAYNPLRGLVMSQIVAWLEAGERGEYASIQWLYRFIEKRDAVLRALVRRRRSALLKLDWDIKIVSKLPRGATAAQAAAQQVALRAAYEQVDNLRAAIAFLAMAEFRGFAHLERHFTAQGDTRHLEPVPQWHWVRAGLNGEWQYNAEAAAVNRGADIQPENFIIREVEDPIDEIAVICFLRKNLSQKDWDGFVETFGIPPVFVEMPPNTPDDKEEEYQELAEAVVSNLRGALPNGAKIQTVETAGRGNNPFRDHLRRQDEDIVMAGTGGLLTMLNDATGLGSGQSKSHQETFDQIAQAEAGLISEIFQKQFDEPIRQAQFSGQPALAYFEIAAKDETDITALADHAAKFSQAGFAMDAKELSEKSGYQLTPKAAPPANPPPDPAEGKAPAVPPPQAAGAPIQNRQSPIQNPKLLAAAREDLARAQARVLLPLRQRLAEIEGIADAAAQRQALEQLRRDLPALLKKINADPATAAAMANALVASFFNGLAESAAQKTAI